MLTARRAAFVLAALLTAGQGAASPGGGPQVQWVYGYGGAETEEHPHAAARTADGGYVIVGESADDARTRIFVVRTDERGALRFARSYGAGRFNPSSSLFLAKICRKYLQSGTCASLGRSIMYPCK